MTEQTREQQQDASEQEPVEDLEVQDDQADTVKGGFEPVNGVIDLGKKGR